VTSAPSQNSRAIEVIRIPRPIRYRDAYRAQEFRRLAVEQGRMGNALFILEHTPVITLGRRSQDGHLLESREELQNRDIELHQANRGGGVTYHGPGQLVAYPILNLKLWRPSIRWYLRYLEQVLMNLLVGYGLKGERIEGATGVWVGGAKIAAIGIGIHNWVTFHGLALNVAPDMSHFDLIVPCGIHDRPVTCLRQLLETAPPMPEVMSRFEQEFLDYFQTAP
jgi:lipoate-protein ligase B